MGQDVINGNGAPEEIGCVKAPSRQEASKICLRQKQKIVKEYCRGERNDGFLRSQPQEVRDGDNKTANETDAFFRPENVNQETC